MSKYLFTYHNDYPYDTKVQTGFYSYEYHHDYKNFDKSYKEYVKWRDNYIIACENGYFNMVLVLLKQRTIIEPNFYYYYILNDCYNFGYTKIFNHILKNKLINENTIDKKTLDMYNKCKNKYR